MGEEKHDAEEVKDGGCFNPEDGKVPDDHVEDVSDDAPEQEKE